MSIFKFDPDSKLSLSLQRIQLLKSLRKNPKPHQYNLFDSPFRAKLPKFDNPSLFDQPQEGTEKDFGDKDKRVLKTTESGKKRWVDADKEPEKARTQPSKKPHRDIDWLGQMTDEVNDFLEPELPRFTPKKHETIDMFSQQESEQEKPETKPEPEQNETPNKSESEKSGDVGDEPGMTPSRAGLFVKFRSSLEGENPDVYKITHFTPGRSRIGLVEPGSKHYESIKLVPTSDLVVVAEPKEEPNSEPEEQPIVNPTAVGDVVMLISGKGEEADTVFQISQLTNGLAIAKDINAPSRSIIVPASMLKVVDKDNLPTPKEKEATPQEEPQEESAPETSSEAPEDEVYKQYPEIFKDRDKAFEESETYDEFAKKVDKIVTKYFPYSSDPKNFKKNELYLKLEGRLYPDRHGEDLLAQAIRFYGNYYNDKIEPKFHINRARYYDTKFREEAKEEYEAKRGKSLYDLGIFHFRTEYDNDDFENFANEVRRKDKDKIIKRLTEEFSGYDRHKVKAYYRLKHSKKIEALKDFFTEITGVEIKNDNVEKAVIDYIAGKKPSGVTFGQEPRTEQIKPTEPEPTPEEPKNKVNYGGESRTEPGANSGSSEAGTKPRGKMMRSNFANECANCGTKWKKGGMMFYNFDNKKGYCGVDCATKHSGASTPKHDAGWGNRFEKKDEVVPDFTGSAEDYF